VPTTQVYLSQGLQLKYLDWGNPTAPLLVLLHGGFEQSHAWDAIASVLSRRWHVIAPDLRGHGDSDWSSGGAYSVLDFVADLAALLKQLADQRVTLIGHSLGGNVAIHFSAIYPQHVHRLCAIEGLGLSPAARADRDLIPRAEQMRRWVERILANDDASRHTLATVTEAAARITKHDSLIDDASAQAFASFGVNQVQGNLYEWKYDPRVRIGGAADVASTQPSDLWSTIVCPILLFYGAKSWASNPLADGRAQYLKNARIVLVDEAGHNVHHHRPREFLEIVLPFIEGV
jgi:pimeloyl-ACP methyl ester carboxylesterase